MTRVALKNYCIEPETRGCCCPRLLCGGIQLATLDCVEHGVNAAPTTLLKTHLHPVQGRSVGTRVPARYDDAKAS